MKKISGIYKFVNLINGKRYIGQSTDIKLRWYRHKSCSKSNKAKTYFNKALRKYGWDNFYFVIIEEVKDLQLLDKREDFWINYYNTMNGKMGYNLCSAGKNRTGYKHTEETKEKIRLTRFKNNIGIGYKHTLESLKKISEASKSRIGFKSVWFGKKFSQEHKNKISQGNIGRKVSLETRVKLSRQVIQYNQNNELIKIWPSITDASKTLNIDNGSISRCCKGIYKTVGGFKWKYKED